MHSRTNKVKIKIHQYFSLTVNIVTKKSKISSAFDYTAMPLVEIPMKTWKIAG